MSYDPQPVGSKEVVAKTVSLPGPSLLSAGEIDARYLKILRMRGEDALADYYRMWRRFGGEEYDQVPIEEQETESSSESELSPSEDELEVGYGGGGVGRVNLHPGAKMGAVSRIILQPEDPRRDQPHKMKKKKEKKPKEPKPAGKVVSEGVKHEAAVEVVMRDFVLYVIFLVICNMITFGVLDHAYNYYANILHELITNKPFKTDLGITKTFNEVRNIQQIWDFINIVLLGALKEYGSESAGNIRIGEKDNVIKLFDNVLIGVPRIRQQRAKNDSCVIHPFFKELFYKCYDYYSDEIEDKEEYGLKLPTAWTYSEPDADSASYYGKISVYGGGGYMMNIMNEQIQASTRNWLTELQNYSWIQQGTRVIFIDFTTYTPNTNLFCVVKLVFELPPTGGVVPTSHFYTMKFLRYVNTWDHFVLGCEIIFFCYVVYFTMEEIQQMLSSKEGYCSNPWNILDLIILVTSYVVILTALVRYVTVTAGMKEKVEHMKSSTHASFDNFVYVQRSFNTAAALLSFLVWIKLLKYAALNRSVALILSVFGRVKFELIALTLTMFTVVVGFALLGNLLFGTHVEQFNTIWNAVFSLVGIFVGGLYFYLECAFVRPVVAPIFFSLYIFIVMILFLNAYVALIVHGFHKAVDEYEDHKRDRVYLGDVCRTFVYKMLKLFGRTKLANGLRNRAIAKENKKDYEEMLIVAKKHGYRGADLAMLFKKHNIAPGTGVPFEKKSQMYNDIDAKNQLFSEVDEHDKIMAEVDAMTKKVESLDTSMASVLSRVDKLVDQLLFTDARKPPT